jgi:hypothetical protein
MPQNHSEGREVNGGKASKANPEGRTPPPVPQDPNCATKYKALFK